MKYIILLLVLFLLPGWTIKQGIKNDPQSKPDKEYLLHPSIKEPELSDSIFNALTKKIIHQEYPNIHSLLIAKDGQLVYEEYFTGADKNLGEDLGMVQFTDTTLHDLRSISKSVVSALIGICMDKGLIQDVNQPVSDFFPEHQFEGEKAQWTIQHFLTMTTGLDWNEKVPYSDPENGEIQMLRSKDPVSYVLNQPLAEEPGTKWNYCGGATLVLGEIITRISHMALDAFAKENLFDPIGIEKFEWNKYSKVSGGADIIAAAAGLRLTPRDMLKFGLLYRNKGLWNGKRILSEAWVRESVERKITYPCDPGYDCVNHYGYQFYSWDDKAAGKNIALIVAIGNGDQRIYLDIDHDILVVVTAGNYNQWDIKNNSYALLTNEIYPALFNNNTR